MDCLVLGNGSSLKDAALPDLPSFGCNFVGYLLQPTFYVCVDLPTLKHPDIITPWARSAKVAYLRAFSSCDPTPRPLYELPNVFLCTRKSFVWPTERAVTGGSSVYYMLKLAYFRGYDRVFLYGVDHNIGHFDERYPQGAPSNFDFQEWHYRLAEKEYKRAGRQIFNCSPPSVLDEIFTRMY